MDKIKSKEVGKEMQLKIQITTSRSRNCNISFLTKKGIKIPNELVQKKMIRAPEDTAGGSPCTLHIHPSPACFMRALSHSSITHSFLFSFLYFSLCFLHFRTLSGVYSFYPKENPGVTVRKKMFIYKLMSAVKFGAQFSFTEGQSIL